MAAPTVPDYNPTTPEDTVLNGTVVGTDPDGDPITYLLGAQATNGVAVVNADGTYTYTPNANYNGSDQFTVLVRDDQLGEATSTVNVTVTAVNDAPVNTVPGAQTTAEDTALTFNGAKTISVNDVDGNLATTKLTVTNGVLNVTLGGGATISAGANGSATLTLSGTQTQINAALATLVFTPTANYNGSAVLTVLSTDAAGTPLTDTDTVAITITAVNDLPVNTVPGAQTTAEDTVLAFTGAKLISVNDVDGNLASTKLTVTNGILNVSLAGGATISAGANGSATLTLAGTQTQINAALATLTYTPTLNYNGAALLTVLSTDAAAATDTDTVAITVTAVNDAPTVPNYTPSTAEDTPYNGTVVGTDVEGQALTYSKGTDPLHGTVVVNANGTYVYTPAANYNGSDSFTVIVSDGSLTATSTITMTVTAVNDVPTIPNYSHTTAEDTPVNGQATGADVDTGQTLTYAKGTGPSHGTAVVSTSGAYTYTPAANYFGPDSFTIVVSDGNGGSATSTVTLTVTAVNDPPVVPNYTPTVAEDASLNGQVVATDVEGDTVTYAKGTGPLHGQVIVNPDGTYVYTPVPNYNGSDVFTVLVSDGHGGTSTSTITVTVTPVNDPPVAGDNNVSAVRDVAKVIAASTLLANDSDIDGDTLTVTAVSAAQHGTVSLSGTNITFTPASGYVGEASFQYTVSDGHGGTAVGTVFVSVEPPPPPTLAEVKDKISAGTTLNYADLLTVHGASEAKLKGLVSQLEQAGGVFGVVYGNADLSNATGILTDIEYIGNQILIVQRKLADLTQGDVTAAQNTKAKNLVTSIGL